MREFVRAESEPELPEIGYHNSTEHVWQIAPAFHGYQQLPEAGGLNDQFADEWDDILNWLALHAYCQWEYNQERGWNDREMKRDTTDELFNTPDSASDWTSVLGE